MPKQTTRTLEVRHTDLDPATHRSREIFQQVGLVEVTIYVTQTGRGETTVSWTGLRQVTGTDGTTRKARLIRHGTTPEWLQALIDDATAEFDTMLNQKVAA